MENNHVAKELQKMLENTQPLFTTQSCCIYRVPPEIRQSNEGVYTPVLVSIGPLHHRGNSRLITMESHKQVYCEHFIRRSEASLTDLVSCLQRLEQQIRACYSERIDLTVEELVKVIFIDCCFVIELFSREAWMTNDAIRSKPWMDNRVMHDLILVENQIPFFVFENIYNLAFASRLHGGEFPSFTGLAFGMFSNYHNKQGVSPPPNGRTIAHFTDLLRYLYLPPDNRIPSRNSGSLVLGQSASELVEAGVKFQVNKSSLGCILDLKFEHGILKIPHIIVDDSTESLLRNIVALEQCHYPNDHYITDYIQFLAQLANSHKDAYVLIKAGIIESMMCGNDTSVAKLFNDVWDNTVVTNFNVNYLKICNDLNAYCKHPCRTLIATLRRDYFTTPWKTAASIGGIILLLLTLVQTICSILQVEMC